METWQADSLATALCQSFPRSSIAADIWAAEFRGLEQARAEEAVRRIRRTSEHAPTIAHLHAVYASLLGSASTTDRCEACCDTGMVTDTDHPRHWPGDATSMPRPLDEAGAEYCDCNVVTWCRACDTGKSAHELLRRIDNQRPRTDQKDTAA